MNLPIDARQAPITEKYLTEETLLLARWFIFGVSPIDGKHDVSWAQGDVFVGLTFQQAAHLCLARKMFVDEVLRIVNKQEPA